MTSGKWSTTNGRTVYAWAESQAEFDKIALPEKVCDWQECSTTTLIKGDGQRWERRCHAKWIEGPVDVIFQWWDERPIGAAQTETGTETAAQQTGEAA